MVLFSQKEKAIVLVMALQAAVKRQMFDQGVIHLLFPMATKTVVISKASVLLKKKCMGLVVQFSARVPPWHQLRFVLDSLDTENS